MAEQVEAKADKVEKVEKVDKTDKAHKPTATHTGRWVAKQSLSYALPNGSRIRVRPGEPVEMPSYASKDYLARGLIEPEIKVQ